MSAFTNTRTSAARADQWGAEKLAARRSAVSPRKPWPTTDPTEDRLLAERSPAPAAVPTADPLTELRKLAVVLAPHAKMRLSASEEVDGISVPVRLYKVELYGPEIGAATVSGQGHNPAAAVDGLRVKWARARRAHAVAGLVSECERLAGEAFTPEARQRLEAEMSGCEFRAFDTLAARWRKAAQKHAA